VILAASPLSTAFAREHTDVIQLKNGDRITGEVKFLENGILKVDVDYVDGTISIDWLKVAQLDSKALFLLQLQDGSIFSTTVTTITTRGSEAAGRLELHPEGREAVIIDSSAVVRMTQTSESLFQRTSGRVTLGTTYSKGNNNTQYNIGSEFDYQETKWGARVTYNSNLTSSSGASAATRNQADLIAYRLLPWTNYFYAGTAGFLQSSVQGIDRQTSLGLGIGRFVKNSNRFRFSLMGGAGWQKDRYSTALDQQTQNIAVAVATTNLQLFLFKKTRLSIDSSVAPTISPSGRLFSRVNMSYYLKVFGKIDWNLSFYGNWDTRPPAGLPSSDYGSSTGLSYSFGNK
jgi:putative salt-induced outer membrane protein YdiY